MENPIYGNIYADVSYGKSRTFQDDAIGYNVDFRYKDVKAMKKFNEFVEKDHISKGNDVYRLAVDENMYNLGERGVVEMSFKSGTVLNQYLQDFLLWFNMNIAIDDVNALNLQGKYDDKIEQAVLAKLAEMRMAYVKDHTRAGGNEK